jgi:hypothetical protein
VKDSYVQVLRPNLVAKPGILGLRSLLKCQIGLGQGLLEEDAKKLQDISQQGCSLWTFTPGRCLLFGFYILYFAGGGATSSPSPSATPVLQTITQFACGYEDELWEEDREYGKVETALVGKWSKDLERRNLRRIPEREWSSYMSYGKK